MKHPVKLSTAENYKEMYKTVYGTENTELISWDLFKRPYNL